MEVILVESKSNGWKRRIPATARIATVMLLGLLALGCGGMPKISYYTLQVPAAPPSSEPRTSFVLGVEHFRAPEVLRDDRIIYYVSPTQMNFYENHRWGADPATLLSDYTAQWLDSSGVFAQVKVLPARARVDYTLGGNVSSFEEVDSGGSAKVRLGLTLSLVRMSDHKLVWSDQRREESPLSEHGVDGVAIALNDSCAQALREMTPGLIAQVEQDFKSRGK